MKKTLLIISCMFLLIACISTSEPSKIEPEAPVAITTPASQKSLVEYYEEMGEYFTLGENKSFLQKTPEELGFKEMSKVKIACPPNPDGPCGGNLLIIAKESLRPGTQEFYFAIAGGAGYSYYGPFTDNLERLVDESKIIDALKE